MKPPHRKTRPPVPPPHAAHVPAVLAWADDVARRSDDATPGRWDFENISQLISDCLTSLYYLRQYAPVVEAAQAGLDEPAARVRLHDLLLALQTGAPSDSSAGKNRATSE